ncbi:MAG: Tfp pilus assembly protein FimT/FimU [Pseudohongiellaceae bacterium]
MKTLQARGLPKSAQSGFTIIELIVVILLLGILTATALPRFLDVTDEAHLAVVNAVQGGLVTGRALFRAQWVATGEPVGTAITEFNSMQANSSGNPIGLDADADATNALSSNQECADVFVGLLQEGRPSVFTSTEAVNAAINQTDVDAAGGEDFIAKLIDNTGPNVCGFAYIGQFSGTSAIADNAIPLLTYTGSTGAIVRGTDL